MAQQNVIAREHYTRVAIETTYGVTPSGSYPESLTEIVPQHDALHIDNLAVEMLEVNDARARRNDAIQPVQGLEMQSKVEATFYAKAVPSSNVLTAAGSVGSLSQCIPFLHTFGAEHAAIGTTVATGSSSTVFDVASAATLKKGTMIAVTISGTPEWTKITNISTDTVTVFPPLSGTPANGAVVRNLRTYAPAESHTSSMTFQFAFSGSSAAQYTVNGVACNVKISSAFGQLVTYALDGTGAKFTGPTDQSITASVVTDDMRAPFVMKGATVLLAATAARASSFVCESVEVDLPNQWQQVRDPGGIETVNSVVNVAGRPRAATAKLRLRFDSDVPAAFIAETGYTLWIVVPQGTGTSQQFFVVEMGNCKIVGRPKESKVGELLYLDIELGALMDDQVTLASETGTDRDFILAPYRVAFG
jgi:hypothetical protein